MHAFRNLVFFLAPLFSMSAFGATHVVTVSDNSFSPAILTIQQGDTVRWENAAGGNPHNVTSDTGAFPASPTAASFVYEVTFNNVGDFNYTCTIHPQQMQGSITVEASMEDPVFPINPGLNDAWFNPSTVGQGLFVNAFPNVETMFVGWFTYETENRPAQDPDADLGEPYHRWLTAIGPFSLESNIVELDVFNSSGGIFDDPTPTDTSDPESYGTVTIEFHDCATGTFTYDLFAIGESGSFPIQRIVPDNNALCQALVDDILAQ